MPKVFEITLHNGVDPRTGKTDRDRRPATRRSSRRSTSSSRPSEKQLSHFVDIKIAGNNIIERLYADYLPAPFLSILIDDCIAKGKDYHAGGARYNTNYIQGVGLGTMTDILTSIKYNVFDKKTVTMKELLAALRHEFRGRREPAAAAAEQDAQVRQRRRLRRRRHEGRLRGLFRGDRRPAQHQGRPLPDQPAADDRPCLFRQGDRRDARRPQGRRAALAKASRPSRARTGKGPTAVLKSAAKMDHVRTGGTLLNQKFTPQLLADEEGIDNLGHLVRSYFKHGRPPHPVQRRRRPTPCARPRSTRRNTAT